MTDNHDQKLDPYGFRFRNWDIYQDSLSYRQEIYKLSKIFPSEEPFALTDQIRRAVNSVILNIAEGSNKSSDKDSRLYINRAHCSLDEVVACLDCALQSNYITLAAHHDLLQKAASIAKRLRAFSTHLNHQA